MFLSVFIQKAKLKLLSDLELVKKYQTSKDGKYLAELYKRFSSLVLGLCIKYLKNKPEAEDATVNIFEKLMLDIEKHEISNFKSWLYMVAKNHCLMILRNKQSVAKKHNEYENNVVQMPLSVQETELEEKEASLTLMEQAIKMLKTEQRACIELFYLQEKCYNEVAEITGYELKKVKSYIQNGKRNLKILIENLQNEIAAQ